jgi:hypothetical protein
MPPFIEKHFLVVTDGVVTGRRTAGREVWFRVEIPEDWVEVTREVYEAASNIGGTYADGVYTAPVGDPYANRVIPLRRFMRLFTNDEMADVFALVQQPDPVTVRFYTLATLEPQADLDDADTLAGLNYLVGKDSLLRPGEKVLTTARRDRIMSNQFPEE